MTEIEVGDEARYLAPATLPIRLLGLSQVVDLAEFKPKSGLAKEMQRRSTGDLQVICGIQ